MNHFVNRLSLIPNDIHVSTKLIQANICAPDWNFSDYIPFIPWKLDCMQLYYSSILQTVFKLATI